MKKIRTYKDSLDYIFSKLPIFQRVGPKALKYDLSNIIKLIEAIGNPHLKFKSIHIAGTNGKGTTSHALASIFQQAGYKTGLYTSPHYKDFRERIKIDGKFIMRSYLKSFIIKHQELIEKIKPSYFELSVALAFKYFADMKVDIAIIEVGLGGRLDSTNIIAPLLSVITNISIDHTQTLGNTLAEIATEKAGIIKHNIPVVIGEKQAECEGTFKDISYKKHSPVYFADDILRVTKIKQNPYCTKLKVKPEIFDINTLKTDLTGPFAPVNVKYTLAAMHVFMKKYKDWNITKDNILKGLRHIKRNTKYIGRWHILSRKPLTIADGAHNIGAIKNTLEYINSLKYNKLHIIFGIVIDKNWDKIFKLLPKEAKYYFTKADIPRAMNEIDLKNHAFAYNLSGTSYKNIIEAQKSVMNNAEEDDLVLILGSIYLVGEVI